MARSYTDLTLTRARAIAKGVLNYGYFAGEPDNIKPDFSNRVGWVVCPDCDQKIVGWSNYPPTRVNLIKSINLALVDHLTMGDCKAHPDLGE